MRRLLPLALILVGCSKGSFNDHKPGGEAVLTYPLETKVTTLDPGKVQDVDMGDVLQNVFEGLVGYGTDNTIEPRLAEKWDITDGGRTFVFHLRDAKFQNGKPVTAADFRWTWERNLSKNLNSPVAGDYLGAIDGAEDFMAGKAKSIRGIKVVDPHTLSVTLDKPRPYFLGNLTYACAYVVSKDAAGPGEIKTAAEAVGTGPFKLSKVAEDTQVDLAANADYWGGKPKVARISRPVVIEAATRLNGYKNGDYDILGVARGDVASVQSDPKLKAQLTFEPRPAIYYFSMNQKGYAPFKDERVRKAFAMALDRKTLVNEILNGVVPANGLVAPGVPGYQEGYAGVPFDPKGAQALLTAAGYPGGKGLPSLELAFRSGRPDARLACEAAATAWRKELNAPVSPKALEWGALLDRRNKDLLQMGYMSWYADYLDPQNFLSLLMMSTSKLNHDGFSDPEFDRLCAKADVDLNPTERLDLYRQAEKLAVEKAARLPFYFERQPQLISPRVKGLRKNLFGLLPHTTVEVGG